MPEISDSMRSAGALADALQDLLRQLIDKTMGGPSHGKGGEPLRDVCTMVLPIGEPIDPRDFSFRLGPCRRRLLRRCSGRRETRHGRGSRGSTASRRWATRAGPCSR